MKYNIRIIKLLFIIVLLIPCVNIFAQGSGNKYSGEFLATGVGGRPLGMGGAYVALVNDVTAGYWNPALLSKITYPQFSLMHDWRFGNLVNYNYGAVGFPFGKDASIGVSMIMLGVDDIPDTRNALQTGLPPGVIRLDPDKITFFNTTDLAFFLTYSKKKTDDFSYGANLKIIRRNIAEESAWGLGFDVGAYYSPFKRMMLGANFQDITTTYMTWTTGKKELITPTLKIGSAYSLDLWKGVLTPVVDFDVRFENRQSSANAHIGPVSFDMHAGAEYCFLDLVSLRGGYNDIGNLTLGAGIKLPKINIDYSFAKFDGDEALGNSHRISLTFTLEEDKFKRK